MKLIKGLYQTCDKKQKNFMFSPYSIHTALAMAKEGAKGATLKELQELLGEDPIKIQSEKFNSANAVWIRGPIVPLWKETIYEKFEAGAYPLISPSEINSWVSRKTNNKITEIINNIRQDDRVILTNAVHFKDDWLHQFKKELTKKEPFWLIDRNEVMVDMMYQNRKIGYLETPTHKAIDIPYKDKNLSMIVILPKPDWHNQIEVHDIEEILSIRFFRYDVRVWLPKFESRWGGSIKQDLINMGLNLSFSDLANFTGMVPRNPDPRKMVKIGDVLHKSYIKVDEEGTEAAAVTGMVMRVLSSSMPPPPKIFRADRPFVYAIVDKRRNVLFLGKMFDPRGDNHE